MISRRRVIGEGGPRRHALKMPGTGALFLEIDFNVGARLADVEQGIGDRRRREAQFRIAGDAERLGGKPKRVLVEFPVGVDVMIGDDRPLPGRGRGQADLRQRRMRGVADAKLAARTESEAWSSPTALSASDAPRVRPCTISLRGSSSWPSAWFWDADRRPGVSADSSA